ncbi:MAG: sulfurtransferase, partial [Thiomonas sp. 14-66-4]
MIQQLSVSELSALLDEQPEQLANWQVIDVREPWEL